MEKIDAALLKELEDMRAQMETKLSSEQKDALAKAIKTVEDKIAEFAKVKESHDALVIKFDEKDKEYQKSLDEMSMKVKELQNKGNAEPVTFAKALSAAVTEKSDEFAKFAREGKKDSSLTIELKTVGDITTGNVTGGSVWGSVYKPGIIEVPKRKVHMRQVLNTGTIGPGTDYYFMRQNGVGEGNPAFTAETGTKPQIDYDLVEDSVKIECLAGYARISKKALNNIPGMLSFLNSRLPESLLRIEDEAVLYGDGVSPNIEGLLDTGNFTASTSTADVLSEAIIDDLARLEDSFERTADFVLMRPLYYYSFFKQKADGSGEYDLPKNVSIVGGVLYISGVPIFASTALHTTDYMVMDRSGADLLFQEQMRIEFAYEDQDNFIKNKVTVRIEEYVALPVYGSDYIIKGTVPTAAS